MTHWTENYQEGEVVIIKYGKYPWWPSVVKSNIIKKKKKGLAIEYITERNERNLFKIFNQKNIKKFCAKTTFILCIKNNRK